ncbi:MAG: hypothetical protein JWO06_91 [Bacteroidota bacterium]|nr:hypothetical protein [Bacteroidota bacterium]
MPKQDNLIQLIKTLSPGERRYFKLFSGLQAGEKKYVRLFELLETRGNYDSGELTKELGITTSQLAVLKHYLNQVLLSSLRSNIEKPTHTDELYSNLADARALLVRRLFAQALEIIEKALDRAWELEQFELIDDLLKVKSNCLIDTHDFDGLQQINKDYRKLTGITEELNEITHLRYISMWLEKERESDAEIKKLLKHPLLKKRPEMLKSLRAQIAWYSTVSNCSKASTGREEFTLARKEWAFYKKHPEIKVIHGMAYVTAFTCIATATAEAGDTDEALTLLSELEQVIDKGEVQVSKAKGTSVKSFIYNMRTIIFQAKGLFEKMLQEIDKVQPLIKGRPVMEQFEVSFSHAAALVHLGYSQQAVAKLDELIQMKLPVRASLSKALRPLLIMAQIDMNNYALLPYLIKSAKAWMKRNTYEDKDYKLFYSLIAETVNPLAPQIQQQAYNKLLTAVNEGKLGQLHDDCALEYWLERKIKKR